MKNFGTLLVLVVLSSLSFAMDKTVIQPYAAMTKAIGRPVPTKEQFQKMLQHFADELHAKAFKDFSEKDFDHGHLMYQGAKGKERLISILYHTQELEVFDKYMRSWWQRYETDKTFAPTNALGMMREDLSSESQLAINKTGTVAPAHLHDSVAGVNMVDVTFSTVDPEKLAKPPMLGDNIIQLDMKGRKIFLVVSYKK